MSLTQKIAHNTAIQLGGKAISTGLGLVAVVMLTRSLGPEQFGWYVTASSFLQFVGIVTDFGFTVTTANMVSEPGLERSRLVNTIFTWRLITALVCQGAASLLILAFPYPLEIKLAVIILSISFVAASLNQVFIGYFQAQLKALFSMGAEVLGRVLLVAGIAWVGFANYGFLAMMLAVSVASVAATIFLLSRYQGLALSIDWAISRTLFGKLWPTALAIMFNAVYLQGDRFILPLFVSQAEVGLYGASYRVLDVVLQMAALIMGILMPQITYAWSRQARVEFDRLVTLAVELMTFLLLPAILGIFLVATPLMNAVGSEEFAPAGILLKYLSTALLGILLGMTFGHIMLAINKQRQALLIYASCAVLSLAGYVIFIRQYGVYGAIGVTIFSELYAGILLTALVFYYTRFRLNFKKLIKIIFATALMGTAVWQLQPAPLWQSLFLGVVSYALLSLLLGIITLAMIREIALRKPPTVV